MTKPKRFTISLTYSEITRIAEAMQKMGVIKPEGPWIQIRRKLIDQLSQQEVERVEMKHLTRCSECRYAIPTRRTAMQGQISLSDFWPTGKLRSCRDCCNRCMMWWSGRCPYGGCWDDHRAKISPYIRVTGETRCGWSDSQEPGEQDHWCRGGIFYPVRPEMVCPSFVEYKGQTVRECIRQNVSVFQDGYILCGIVDSVGCERCYRELMEREEAEEGI